MRSKNECCALIYPLITSTGLLFGIQCSFRQHKIFWHDLKSTISSPAKCRIWRKKDTRLIETNKQPTKQSQKLWMYWITNQHASNIVFWLDPLAIKVAIGVLIRHVICVCWFLFETKICFYSLALNRVCCTAAVAATLVWIMQSNSTMHTLF